MGVAEERQPGDSGAEFGIEEPELRAEGRSIEAVDAVSSVDGRYRRVTEELAPYFSDRALFSHRLTVEAEYLIALSEHPEVGCREFTDDEKGYLRSLPIVDVEQANVSVAIEKKGFAGIEPTNHDVKAVEYYLRLKMEGTSLEDSLQWTHFALTSEDVTNIAYALMTREANENVILPAIREIEIRLAEIEADHLDVPMLSRTHNQPASPTTVGKTFRVFRERIAYARRQVQGQRLRAKLNGATGNFNAHFAAYPMVDWVAFSQDFIEGLNNPVLLGRLEANPTTTQVEPHDSAVTVFDALSRLNLAVVDMNRDIWQYIGDKWLTQPPEGVGSSTMPNKVNPIDFENGEGRMIVANSLFGGFHELLVSRLQRHLSDSTIQREVGSAYASCLIGYKSTLKGLNKISVNEAAIRADLVDTPEVVSEAIQTILRREGHTDAYEVIKAATQGKALDAEGFAAMIDDLDVSDEVKAELRAITPLNYIGNANRRRF